VKNRHNSTVFSGPGGNPDSPIAVISDRQDSRMGETVRDQTGFKDYQAIEQEYSYEFRPRTKIGDK
jgi:hypothetical protein